MGPESEKRAPGAINYRKNWWRLPAIAAVAVATGVYNEGGSPINHPPQSDSTHTIVLGIKDFTPSWENPLISPLPTSGEPQQRLQADISQIIPEDELVDETVYVDTQLAIPTENEAESITESPPPIPAKPISQTPVLQIAAAPSASTQPADGEVSRITGYYCQQVPGYYIGDGGGFCGRTASGEIVRPGVAACGYKWKLGTELHIEGYGEVVCLDRGHLAWNQVDVFFPTNKDLVESGKPEWARVTAVEE